MKITRFYSSEPNKIDYIYIIINKTKSEIMATITIHTQYYENYSDSTTPYWKAKGGQTFTIENIEGDLLMYANNLKKVLSDLVSAKSNEHYRYEYREHDVDFVGADTSITAEMLDNGIRKQFNELEKA